MATWTELLDAYEASVTALERAVAAGDVPDLPRWREPERAPAAPPTDAHWHRFVGLQEREARCQAAARQYLQTITVDLEASRRTATAAAAYANPGAPRRA